MGRCVQVHFFHDHFLAGGLADERRGLWVLEGLGQMMDYLRHRYAQSHAKVAPVGAGVGTNAPTGMADNLIKENRFIGQSVSHVSQLKFGGNRIVDRY
jgi:hypothetical protein